MTSVIKPLWIQAGTGESKKPRSLHAKLEFEQLTRTWNAGQQSNYTSSLSIQSSYYLCRTTRGDFAAELASSLHKKV